MDLGVTVFMGLEHVSVTEERNSVLAQLPSSHLTSKASVIIIQAEHVNPEKSKLTHESERGHL